MSFVVLPGLYSPKINDSDGSLTPPATNPHLHVGGVSPRRVPSATGAVETPEP